MSHWSTFAIRSSVQHRGRVTTCVVAGHVAGHPFHAVGTAVRDELDTQDDVTGELLATGRALEDLGRAVKRLGWGRVERHPAVTVAHLNTDPRDGATAAEAAQGFARLADALRKEREWAVRKDRKWNVFPCGCRYPSTFDALIVSERCDEHRKRFCPPDALFLEGEYGPVDLPAGVP